MKKSDILAYIKDKVSSGAYVYKTVISLTGEDSEKYGYTTKDDWENLIRANIKLIADEYNIKVENLDWVASFHTEERHPHIHFVFYFMINQFQKKLNHMFNMIKLRRS